MASYLASIRPKKTLVEEEEVFLAEGGQDIQEDLPIPIPI
jgi:hypothetical protein